MKVLFTANGNQIAVDADVATTVRMLKSEIQDRTGIPPNFQHIYCKGTQMQDMNATIGSYVTGDETLELHVDLKGGCGESCGCCGCGESCYCTIL